MAKLLGCTKKQIKKGLETFKPSNKRMEIIKKNGITIINDTYNANPQSMKAALETLAEFRGRKIAILGDMLELGRITKQAHKEIENFAKKIKIDQIIRVHQKENKKNVIKQIKKIIRPRDIILIKASRGLHLEEIVSRL